MLTLFENAEVFTPRAIGVASVLVVEHRVALLGDVDRAALERTGLPLDVVDARGAWLLPGLIDPHEHLLGGSGERGFSSQTPMITLREIVHAGITTVVGALGVDTTMKTMAGLVARVKGLREEGLSAYLWSGGYNVPPSSVTQSIRNDMMFIAEVIGAGEIAIADARGLCPLAPELAKLVLDTHVGGLLSGKAGRTHFHVGEHPQRLARLRELLDGDFAVSAEMLYPTHVGRNEALMDEAVALARRGSFVDVDTVEGGVAKWFRYYHANGGPADRLTFSSDAGASSPVQFLRCVLSAVFDDGVPLEDLLPCVTSNTAAALCLNDRGRIEPGRRADLVALDPHERTIRHLMCAGRLLVRDGALLQHEAFLQASSRRIDLVGTAA